MEENASYMLLRLTARPQWILLYETLLPSYLCHWFLTTVSEVQQHPWSLHCTLWLLPVGCRLSSFMNTVPGCNTLLIVYLPTFTGDTWTRMNMHTSLLLHTFSQKACSHTHTHTYEPSTAIRSSQNTNSHKIKSLNINCPAFCQTFRFISRVSLISTRNIFFLRVMFFFLFFFIYRLNSSVLPLTWGSFLRFIYPENET